MTQLTDMHCKPCEGGVEPMDADEAGNLLGRLADGWEIDTSGKEIRKDFHLTGFYKTM